MGGVWEPGGETRDGVRGFSIGSLRFVIVVRCESTVNSSVLENSMTTRIRTLPDSSVAMERSNRTVLVMRESLSFFSGPSAKVGCEEGGVCPWLVVIVFGRNVTHKQSLRARDCPAQLFVC